MRGDRCVAGVLMPQTRVIIVMVGEELKFVIGG